MKLLEGGEVKLSQSGDGVILRTADERDSAIVSLTNSEAIELAAELVKLAMPDAKPDTAPVSIM